MHWGGGGGGERDLKEKSKEKRGKIEKIIIYLFKKGKRRGKKGSMKSKALSPNSLGMDPMKKSSPPHYQNVYRNKM